MTAEQVYEEYRKAITEKYGVGYVRVEAFLYPDEGVIKPYTDLGNIEIVNQVSTTDNNLISALTNASMSLNLNDDIRQSRTQKSATAGTDVYGPDSARTGTDSITFRGLVRGS
ncbi:MAG: hypothetical protein GWN01_12280 [Nitrosopumilaceae archaeon]|nr:hypothetical protein [Nitrosopumilaceae archaeon]NIU88364.1 hypothetical protein [Nitrosopumilaceae archaeon]NIV66649.1 hypothetical protein [Nitrosopumilaceae archaeon]NIX62254.1 hypothetical protein [Nitrosopumilaceae archaeon]